LITLSIPMSLLFQHPARVKPLGQPARSCCFHLHRDDKVTEALEQVLGERFLVAVLEVVSRMSWYSTPSQSLK
jgi:hypothetical protein